MIKELTTVIANNGKATIKLTLNTKDKAEIQVFLNKVSAYIYSIEDERFQIDHVDFYNEEQAVEDLQNLLKLSTDKKD